GRICLSELSVPVDGRPSRRCTWREWAQPQMRMGRGDGRGMLRRPDRIGLAGPAPMAWRAAPPNCFRCGRTDGPRLRAYAPMELRARLRLSDGRARSAFTPPYPVGFAPT